MAWEVFFFSASVSSNLIKEPKLLCDPNHSYLISYVPNVSERLAIQSKPQMKDTFFHGQTRKKVKFHVSKKNPCEAAVTVLVSNQTFSKVFREWFLPVSQAHKNQSTDLPEQNERFCSTFPLFAINNAMKCITFIRCYLLSILLNERAIETVVIMKPNLFFPSKFGTLHFLDNLFFFEGSTNLEFFLISFKKSETISIFCTNCLITEMKQTTQDFALTKPFTPDYKTCGVP